VGRNSRITWREGGARECFGFHNSHWWGDNKPKLTVVGAVLPSHLSAKRGQSCSFKEYPFLESVVPADAGLPPRPCQVPIVGRTAFIPRLFRYGDNVLARSVGDQMKVMLLPPTPVITTQAPGKHGGDRPGNKRKMSPRRAMSPSAPSASG